MADLYDKAKDQRGILQRIGQYIPGYGGYSNRETRRDCDKMEREFVATKLFNQKSVVKRAVSELTDAGIYEGLIVFEKLMNKIDKVAQKIRAASEGYSGMFDSIKIGDAELEKLHQYDLGLAEAAKEVEQGGAELATCGGDGAKATAKAKQLSDLIDRIDEYFSKRGEIVAKG